MRGQGFGQAQPLIVLLCLTLGPQTWDSHPPHPLPLGPEMIETFSLGSPATRAQGLRWTSKSGGVGQSGRAHLDQSCLVWATEHTQLCCMVHLQGPSLCPGVCSLCPLAHVPLWTGQGIITREGTRSGLCWRGDTSYRPGPQEGFVRDP